jgi:hypothetical protein
MGPEGKSRALWVYCHGLLIVRPPLASPIMKYQTRIIALLVVSVAVVAITQSVFAFRFVEGRWSSEADIVLDLQLGGSGGLVDGSADWDACANAALADWNTHLADTGRTFGVRRGGTQPPAQRDGINSVFWADSVFGTRLGANTLAVTSRLIDRELGVETTTEADVIFNETQQFNCYRGAGSPGGGGASDLKRVALHAFGHVLGLAARGESLS